MIPLVLALLVVCVPVAASAQTEVPLQTLPMAPQSAETSDAFLWRFAPPVGSRWTMRTFTRSVAVRPSPAGDARAAKQVKSTLVRKMTIDYDVLSRDALNATTIRLTLRKMTSDTRVESEGSVTKYWLADPNSVNGTRLTIKQSPEGKIWSVLGLRAFQRKILETDSFGDAVFIDTILDPNPMTGDSDTVKSLSKMVGTLPTSPVRVGQSWAYDVSLPPSLLFDISGARTLKSLDSREAVVADTVSYTSQTKPSIPSPLSKVGVDFGQLDGSINSTSRVQRSSDLPLETTENQTVKGNLSRQGIATPFEVASSSRIVLEPR